MEEFPRLGLEFLGKCSYDPSSPNRIYFSIGEAIAAIAIFIAFTQLLRPMITFRLSNSPFKLQTAYKLFFVAIFSVFAAAIVPFIPGNPLPLLGYPVFWEILAGFLFVIGALGFIWTINRYAKLNNSNYKQYLRGCTLLIGKGKEDDLSELADEIYESIPEVLMACKKFDRDAKIFAKREGKEYELSEYTNYTLTLLDVWSDEKFCRILVCTAPKTIIYFFQKIEEYKIYSSGGNAFVNQIIRQAFLNKSSILHREEDFYGLGHFKTFTKAVFGNYELIESFYRPLQAWDYWRDDNLEPWKVKKYVQCLNIAIKSYFSSRIRDFGYPAALFSAYDVCEHISMIESIKLDKANEDEIYNVTAFNNLMEVSKGLEESISIVNKYEGLIPQCEIEEKNYNKYKDFSIYGVIANGIYGFYKSLSIARQHDTAVRMIAIGLWLKIYPVSDELETIAIKEIQKRLNLHLIRKVEENLEKLYYPAITRLLISILGLWIQEYKEEKKGELFFKDKFIELIKKHYKKAEDQDSQKAKDMIPDSVSYDKEGGRLIQKTPFGNEYILDLR